MGIVCHACGYERTPTDQAPDWECPSCGKAYVKTSHGPHGSLSGLVPSFPSEPVNRLQEGPTYRQEPGGSAFNETRKSNIRYGPVFGIILGILFVWGIPILSNPSSASAVLLHGDVVWVFMALLAIWGMIVVARRLSANADANNPWSRFAAVVKFFALFAVYFLSSQQFGYGVKNMLRSKSRPMVNE